MTSNENYRLPPLHELAADLTRISVLRRTVSLAIPFAWAGLYFVCANYGWWPAAVLCLVCLSFVTYGSVSHDLVHGNLGLSRRTNDVFLTLIELMALRSGHAYRMAHLHHHARYPGSDDIEGAASDMSLARTLLEGVVFQVKIFVWAVKNAKFERRLIIMEGLACLSLIVAAIVLAPITLAPLAYVILMIMGSWVIPLVTSYIPHAPHEQGVLFQTRRFRGRVASALALEHLYHLEHHLYPAVPHHHWPALAKRLDPLLDDAGVKAVKLGF